MVGDEEDDSSLLRGLSRPPPVPRRVTGRVGVVGAGTVRVGKEEEPSVRRRPWKTRDPVLVVRGLKESD